MGGEIEGAVLSDGGGWGVSPEVEVWLVGEDADDASLVVVLEVDEGVGGALDEVEKAAWVVGDVADGVFGVGTETFEAEGGVEGGVWGAVGVEADVAVDDGAAELLESTVEEDFFRRVRRGCRRCRSRFGRWRC